MAAGENKDERTYAIIGALMEVHRELGCGFLEAVYREALALESAQCEVPFQREVELPITYKSRRLAASYRADFVCFDSVVVEIKAISRLSGIEEAQIINYLKATGREIGILLNFGPKSLEYRRFAFSKSVKSV
jgi:GxxExxY protein